MDVLVAALMSWLSANSSFDTSNIPPPTIVELSPEALTREYYSDSPVAIPANGIDQRVQALYSWEDGPAGTIYLLSREHIETGLGQETGLDNPLFQERLLHELVHHVQFHLGEYETYKCTNQGELDAYNYAGKFLKQHNVMDPLPNRAVLAHIYSRC